MSAIKYYNSVFLLVPVRQYDALGIQNGKWPAVLFRQGSSNLQNR